MSNFTDGAPRTPKDWHDLGYYIMPCTSEGVPMMKGWNQEDYSDQLIKKGNWNSKVYGLRLDEIVDIDAVIDGSDLLDGADDRNGGIPAWDRWGGC